VVRFKKLQKKFAKALEGLSPAERGLLLQQSLEEEKPHSAAPPGCKPFKKSAARCACAAAEKIARLSSFRTLFQWPM